MELGLSEIAHVSHINPSDNTFLLVLRDIGAKQIPNGIFQHTAEVSTETNIKKEHDISVFKSTYFIYVLENSLFSKSLDQSQQTEGKHICEGKLKWKKIPWLFKDATKFLSMKASKWAPTL